MQIDFATSLFFGIFSGNRQLLFHLWPASAHQEIHFRDTGETEDSAVFDICTYFKKTHFFQKMAHQLHCAVTKKKNKNYVVPTVIPCANK